MVNISKNILFLSLNCISSSSIENTAEENQNYPKNIGCVKKLIFHKSSCVVLFDVFKNKSDFCIRYI